MLECQSFFLRSFFLAFFFPLPLSDFCSNGEAVLWLFIAASGIGGIWSRAAAARSLVAALDSLATIQSKNLVNPMRLSSHRGLEFGKAFDHLFFEPVKGSALPSLSPDRLPIYCEASLLSCIFRTSFLLLRGFSRSNIVYKLYLPISISAIFSMSKSRRAWA